MCRVRRITRKAPERSDLSSQRFERPCPPSGARPTRPRSVCGNGEWGRGRSRYAFRPFAMFRCAVTVGIKSLAKFLSAGASPIDAYPFSDVDCSSMARGCALGVASGVIPVDGVFSCALEPPATRDGDPLDDLGGCDVLHHLGATLRRRSGIPVGIHPVGPRTPTCRNIGAARPLRTNIRLKAYRWSEAQRPPFPAR